jgi:CheY-like chemotaxis protein
MTNAINEKAKNILIIEDDKFYGNIFKTKFTQLNYNVAIAQDGIQGIAEAKKQKPDLILLDLIMPLKNGFETLIELKNDPSLKDIKVIVLSNLGQEDDVQKAKKIGAVEYIIKANVSLQEVVDKVNLYL